MDASLRWHDVEVEMPSPPWQAPDYSAVPPSSAGPPFKTKRLSQ